MKKIQQSKLKHKTKTLSPDLWRYGSIETHWGTDEQGRMWSKFERDDDRTIPDHSLETACLICNKKIVDKKEWVCLDTAEQACEECIITAE